MSDEDWGSFSDFLKDEAAGLPTNNATTEALPSEVATELPDNNATLLPSNHATKMEGERNVHWAQLNTRIRKQLNEQMEIYCFFHKVSKREFIESAIATKLQSDNATKQPRIDNDLDDGLTDEEIFIFYRKWTGNRITDGDRKFYREIQHFAPHVIQCGILLSLQRAPTRVNSLRYCKGAIEEMAASGAGRDYVTYLMRKVTEGKQ